MNQISKLHPDWLIWLGIGLLTLVGGLLRFHDLDRLGFRIDEGFTLTYSRQSWPDVIGLHGFYSPHPPLFFSLAKFANLFVSETISSRAVSAFAGTATIPVYFAMCRRAGETGIAFGAATLLAISPLHLEYSRDGRMYALVLLLIAIAWLAYVSFVDSGNRIWLPVLAVALAAAFYADYSAAYAAVPLGIAILVSTFRGAVRGYGLVIAAGASLLLYLPWVPQVVDTVRRSSNATRRADYLGASWERIWESVPVLLGFERWQVGADAAFANPWHRWADYRLLLFVPVIIVVVIAVHQRSMINRLLAIALLIVIGTPLAAIALSLASPGYAARTVMAVGLGWGILASAGFIRRPLARPVRSVGIVAWVVLASAQLMTLPAIYEVQGRGEWPEIADDLTMVEPLGHPVLVFSTAGMLTDVLDLYGYSPNETGGPGPVTTLLDGERETWTGAERWLDRGITLEQMENGALADALIDGENLHEAVWVILRFGGSQVPGYLGNLGYQPVATLRYPDTALVLYALPDARIGEPILVPADFEQSGDPLSGWSITDSRAEIQSGTVNGEEVATLVMTEDKGTARFRFSPGTAGLVSLDVDVRGPADVAVTAINCVAADAESLGRASVEDEPDSLDAGVEDWRRVRLSAICPVGTKTIEVILSRRGETEVAFANVRVQFAPLADD